MTLRIRDVCERLQVTPSKVRGWIQSGRLRAMDVSSGDGKKARWRIRPEDLEAFELSLMPTPTARASRRRAKSGWTFQYF
jgi:excisionase family DNA binding protein